MPETKPAETVQPVKTPSTQPFPKKKVAIGMGAVTVIVIGVVVALMVSSNNAKSSPNNNGQNTGQFNYLPENTCPDSVFVENGQGRADKGDGHYLITDSQRSWIEGNCKNVSGITKTTIPAGDVSQSSSRPTSQSVVETEPPLLLGSVGFKFEDYNPATGKAGDIVFTKTPLPFDQIHGVFGQQDPRSPNDTSKRNPQPVVILPLGTKILSIVTGEVVEVKELYLGDMTVWVAKDKQSQYFYETEHIINPTVKVGDKVTAGQVIGEVSNYDSHNNPGFGLIELGILHPTPDGGVPEHLCPFNYLDPSIKDKVNTSFTKLHAAWNQYLGKQVYNYTTFATPGCVTLEGVDS